MNTSKQYDIVMLAGHFEIFSGMQGIGFRIWEIAKALSNGYGLRVCLVVQNESDLSWNGIDIIIVRARELTSVLPWSNNFFVTYECDQHFIRAAACQRKKIIFDALMTPIEVLHYQKIREMSCQAKERFFKSHLSRYREILRRSDYFISGSFEERQIMIGQLLMVGKISSTNESDVNRNIDIIPIGFDRCSLVAPWCDLGEDRIFLWNGGVWNHYDVGNVILALKQLHEKDARVKLRFLYKSGTDTFRHVTQNCFSGLILPERDTTYQNRSQYIESAYGIIVIANNSLESYTTLRLRLRDALLYVKPMIVSKNGLLGRFVEQHEIGLTVDNSMESICEAVEALLNRGHLYAACTENILRLRDEHIYESTCDRFVDYIKDGFKL